MKPSQRNYSLDFSGNRLHVITDEHLFTSEVYYNDRISKQSSAHFHIYYEVYYVAKGALLLKADNRVLNILENQACLIPPFLEHSPITSGESTICIIEIEAPQSGPGLRLSFPQTPFICRAEEDMRYLEIMRTLSYKRDAFSALRIQAYMTLLIANLVERFQSDDFEKNDGGPAEEKRKQQIDQYIMNSFAGNPSNRELAELLHLSTKQTDRVVRQITGYSLKALIVMQRMITARELILRGAYDLTEISEIVGFRSYNGFYTAFLNYYGAPPLAYRKRLASAGDEADGERGAT